MAWIRRVNENNVDLNRNFIPDGRYAEPSAAYGAVDAFLNPKSPPSQDYFLLRTTGLILRHGFSSLLQTVAGGQYSFPRGLFFGGQKREEGLSKYHDFLTTTFASSRRVLGIDVHTGIGRYARDLLIVEPDNYDTLRVSFGKRVILSQPDHLPTYRIRGGHHELLESAARHAGVRFLTQEFGTYNPIKVFHALREENRWHHYGDGTLNNGAKQTLKEMFCPRSEQWRGRVLARGREVFDQALQNL